VDCGEHIRNVFLIPPRFASILYFANKLAAKADYKTKPNCEAIVFEHDAVRMD